jgi:competence protein ComEA
MKWRQFAADYLTFTRKDRLGILVVIFMLSAVFVMPVLFPKAATSKQTNLTDTGWIAAARKLELKEAIEKTDLYEKNGFEDNSNVYQYDRSQPGNIKAELFYFDPNTITADEWKRLGLRDKTIKTIQNYLSKGGHFYKPEGLAKIYGLKQDEYERLEPYIRIGQKENAPAHSTQNESFTTKPTRTERYMAVDINMADTTAFIALPGIGSKLAVRIINFRNKLGGFYSVNQVGETFGLPDSTFQKIKQYLVLENVSVKKININTATVDELKAHPYIRYSLANPIVAYRNEHGPFTKVEDIKKVMMVTDEIYNKIAPYLSTQ